MANNEGRVSATNKRGSDWYLSAKTSQCLDGFSMYRIHVAYV